MGIHYPLTPTTICKAFSCLATKSGKVYWKIGVDSHEELLKLFGRKDIELKDDKVPPNNTFARVEIHPRNGNYLKPDVWRYVIDEKIKPAWIGKSHEKLCWKEHDKWKKELYSSMDTKGLLGIKNPFRTKPPKITKKHLEILSHLTSVRDSVLYSVWYSVWGSVGDSVGGSVRNSVRDSVLNSVWYSVGDSVGDSVGGSVRNSVLYSVWYSVWDSVSAQIGIHFKKIKEWKYLKSKHKGYPFKVFVKLWGMGLVSSFDGEKWRLHGGRKAKILWEGTLKELKQQVK